MSTPARRLVVPADETARVTTLELFFDLVFVFALTQVTALMADDLTGRGLLRGLLILGLLWWSWTGYAWLFNLVVADEGVVRLLLFAVMTPLFVMALTIPEAFDDMPGGLHGPVVFACCYLAVRLLHLLCFWILSRGDPGLRRQVMLFTPSVAGGTGFLLVASQAEGTAQTVLWALALAADFGGTFLGGASGWRLRSPGHFAERHGLIIIVALGESIVAIGVGVAALPISWPIVAASILGLAVAGALWWAYFDTSALVGERTLHRASGAERAALGRDAYSFLHVPLIAGIVLVALGMKKVLEYVGDTEHHELSDPLSFLALLALYGGVAVYLLGHVGFKMRTAGIVAGPRIVAAAVLLAALPLAANLPALAALALLAAVTAALIGYETVRFAEVRDRVRHEGETPSRADHG
jgi:low temperature requirement protein LtrA